MSNVLTPDICVIGAGSAGLTVAAAAASFGVPVVLVERGKMGGDCLNTGCVPSKALLAAANRAQAVRDAGRFGIVAGEPRTNFAAVMAHVRRAITAIEPNDSAERLTGLGVRVISGVARFADAQTLKVGETEIRARRFVIATGSRPAIPPIPNLIAVPYLTNETVFDLKRLPAHLIVIGGGPIGIELAQAFRRLGSTVTVLEAEKALAKDNPELTALLLESLRAEGIDIREGTSVTRVARRGRSGVRVTLEGPDDTAPTIDGTHLLVATGRRPDLEELSLEKARVRFDAKGIRVNSRLRTRNRRIYAIGDAVGGPQFTHWAGYQAGLVVRSILFRFGGKVRHGTLPWVTFTEPELAHVGLSEEEARRRYRNLQVLRWPFAENDRAQTEGDHQGLMRVLVTKGGTIVGADILGREAGELIAPFVLAVARGMKIKDFATALFPYPTRAEAARRAAIAYYAPKLDSPLIRWVVRFMRKLR